MFCSWRKSPTAPCSCAFQLGGPVGELLNHLCCLGRATLILRQQGLSLAKSTDFGLWISSREGDWQVLRDRLSGLEADTGRPQHCYLLTGFGEPRPVIAFGEPGRPIHFSIRLENHRWESRCITDLIEHFKGQALDCTESRRLGAGAWLDEWERPTSPRLSAEEIEETRERIRRCRDLEVEVRTATHRGTARFTPSFVDLSGCVLRIADRSLVHVVHADAGTADFTQKDRGTGCLQITPGIGTAA